MNIHVMGKKEQSEDKKHTEKQTMKEEEMKAASHEKHKAAHEEYHKKIEKLTKENNELKTQLEQSDGRLQAAASQFIRLQADFDNYRKRNDKLALEAEDKTKAKVLKDFLPVVDNFDIALKQMEKEDPNSTYVKGFVLLQKQLKKILKDYDIQEIEAEGKPFDPHFHEAVMQVQNDKLDDDSVAMVLQKGYTYKKQVLRPAKVQVVHNN